MAVIAANRVTVTTSPTVIAAADQQSVCLQNVGTVTVDLGGASVATGAGYPLAAGCELAFDLQGSSGALYGVVATGTCVVAVIKTILT